MEELLREVPESASIRALAKTLSPSIDLPGGVLVSNWDLHDILGNLIFANREVGEIRIYERRRQTDLKWVLQGDNPRWIRPLSDWPHASDNVERILARRRPYLNREHIAKVMILRPNAAVEFEGITDEMVISAFDYDFFLKSPIQDYFSKETSLPSTHSNDLRWMLLTIVCDNVNWVRGPSHAERVFEELGKEEGLWVEIINYCGETASEEISAFRAAVAQSSWKRFGANLWTRGGFE